MATAFNKNYTELSNVNNGNQLQNGDDILGDHVNVALQNTAHFKDLTNNTVIRSASLSNNTIHLVLASKTNTENVITTNLDIDISNLNGVKRSVSSGGYTSTIYNGGDRVTISVGDGVDDYTLRLTRDGTLELQYDSTDPEEGTTTTSTYDLLKYPCFVRLYSSSPIMSIFVNTLAPASFSTYQQFLRRVPSAGTAIQASGRIEFGGHLAVVVSVTPYTNYLEVNMLRIVDGDFVYASTQVLSSNVSVTGNIVVF